MSSTISLLIKNKLDAKDATTTLKIDSESPLETIKEKLHQEFGILKKNRFVFLFTKKVLYEKKPPKDL